MSCRFARKPPYWEGQQVLVEPQEEEEEEQTLA